MPKIYAIFGSLLFALNPFMTYFSANEILSDIPFLLFGFVALIILAKLFGKSKDSPSLAEGDKGGGLNTRKNSNAKFSSNKSTHPLTPSAREGEDSRDLPRARDGESVDCHDSLRESRNDDKTTAKYHNNGIFIAIFGGIFMLFASIIRINGFVILCALISMHGIILLKRFTPKIFQTRILKSLSYIDSPYPLQIHAIPYIIFALGFIVVSITLSSCGSGHFSALANISTQTILGNLKALDFSWFISLETGADFALAWACVLFILFGIYANLKDSESNETTFYTIFTLGFFALLLLWVAFEKRFVLLLLPFLVFWCFEGVLCVNQKLITCAVAVLIMFILVNLAWINMRDIAFIKTDTNPDNAYNAEAKELYKFIIDNTPKDAIIISFKPRIIYLNTHRLGFVSPKIERLDEADFVLWNGKYTLDSHTMQDISSPTFQAKTNLIFENAEYKFFKVLK